MYATTVLTAAMMGFTWGYQPLDDQRTEYIVQLRQHELQVLADGTHEIISEVPPEAGPIGQVRILVGNEVLPRRMLPPKPLHVPGELTQPATALHANRDRSRIDWRDDNTNSAGHGTADPNTPPDIYYPPQANRGSQLNRYRALGNRWTSVAPPIRPEPADDGTFDTHWAPPLAQPYPASTTNQRIWDQGSITPYHTNSDNTAAAPIHSTPQQDFDASDSQTLQFPRDTIDQPNSFGDRDPVSSINDNAPVSEKLSLVEVPPISERGQGFRSSEPDTATHRSQPSDPTQTPQPANRSELKWDWSQLARNPAGPDDSRKPGPPASGSDQETEPENSPSSVERNLEGSESDNSPWRTWALLLGPISIALAGLNVYQWGIYKSVRRRYLALLRRTGEV